MGIRKYLVLVVLFCACASWQPAPQDPWIDFRYAPGWVSEGRIRGQISHSGFAKVVLYRRDNGLRVVYEKQLRPEDMGNLRSAIESSRARFQKLNLRDGLIDAGELDINVSQDGEETLHIFIAGPFPRCNSGFERPQTYDLWNAIVRAIRSPDHDTLDYVYRCY